MTKIFGDLNTAIKNDIELENERIKNAKENEIKNKNTNLYEILKENTVE